MTIDQLREEFIRYFQQKQYSRVDSAPLIPENDSSVLFTTAGMQQFKPYYAQPELAAHHAVTSVQPVIRTTDIAEVGDHTHLTMFEMLGNFRFGLHDSVQMKERAISEAWEFICDTLKVNKDRIHVTVFEGDEQTPADTESEKIWQTHGVKIVKAGRADNFWGPTGSEGPCGPTTEIYIDDIEVWNLVFNQYYCDADKKFTELEWMGLDTGSGLERLSTVLQGKNSVWQISPYTDWVEFISNDDHADARIIADHTKAMVFLISAGITPSNKAHGYVLRRLIRKTVYLASKLGHELDWLGLVTKIQNYYAPHYTILSVKEIWPVIEQERLAFTKNLTKATKHLERWLEQTEDKSEKAVTELAFYMYESFGFPKELVLEQLIRLGHSVDLQHFEQLFAKHQEISRSGTVAQFKGGLADHSEQTIKHHTAHHLLLAALRQVLGPEVHQKGSNVTSERLRIDFSFDRKVEKEELEQVERIVNEKIKANLPVEKAETSKEQALASGALAEFGAKYGDIVSVYTIGDFSKELCGGPHVNKTGELGQFKILKEEASSQGVRRIKAKVT